MLLNELLHLNRIKIDIDATDWEEAIDAGGMILLEEGLIEPRYIQAIKESKEKFGPYIVIAPGIAISHSKPEDGVIRAGMSLIRLKNPVSFGHSSNDPVSLIFTLAATDNIRHLKALKQLMYILLNKEDLDKLFTAQGIDEIAKVITEYSL
jgi:mannitol/fructose-specific phosphotransferase system IIA component (Ntr-type)